MDIIFFILRISFIAFSVLRYNSHQKNPRINKFYIMQYIVLFIIKFDIILLYFDLNLIQRIMNSRFFQISICLFTNVFTLVHLNANEQNLRIRYYHHHHLNNKSSHNVFSQCFYSSLK